MKKILFLSLLAFASCSKNDDDSNNVTLSRKWHQVKTTVDGVIYPYDDHEDCGKDYIEFYGENSVKSVDIFDCEADVDWIGTYSTNDNFVTIYVDSQSQEFEIDTLTSSKLILKYTTDYNDDGILEIHLEEFSK